MRVETRNLYKGLAFLSPWILGFGLFTLLPFAMSLYYSFCEYSLLQSPVFIGLENYRALMHDTVFWKVAVNTAYYAVLALPMALGLALLFAILLNARIRGQTIFRTLIFLPSLVPAAASAMIWLVLLNTKLGLLNFVLRRLGVDSPPGWITDARWALPAMVLISFWGVGNTVVIFLAGLQDVPRELFEAAELDGAGKLQSILHVTLPVLSPVIFFNLIIGIIGTLQIFTLPFLMTQGGPARATYFYTQYMYDTAFQYLKMGYASAMAWILLLAILALTGLAFWGSNRWVHYQK